MAQHDYVLENQSGALFRQDLNNALRAIAENNMGATAPTATYAGQWWLDTSTNPATLRLRNNANTAWVNCGNLNELSYLAGVTSGIQAQLNEKAGRVDENHTRINTWGEGTNPFNSAIELISDNRPSIGFHKPHQYAGTLSQESFDTFSFRRQDEAIARLQAHLAGTPTAPTAPAGTNTDQIATTAFVRNSFTQNLGVNGWTRLPNGLIIQWGKIFHPNRPHGDIRAVSFNINFPGNCFFIIAHAESTLDSTTSAAHPTVTRNTQANNAGFSNQVGTISGATMRDVLVSWIAIGY